MSRILVILLLTISLSSSAQEKLKVWGKTVHGKVDRIEARSSRLYYDKDGKLLETDPVEGANFYYDEKQVLVKEEQVLDITGLDGSNKRKVKIVPQEITVTAPRPKLDTIYDRSDTSLLRSVPDGKDGKLYIYTANVYPNKEMYTWLDKDGKITSRRIIDRRPDGTLIQASEYSEKSDFKEILFDETYDTYGNRTGMFMYENGKVKHARVLVAYQYDDHGNVVKYQEKQWDEQKGDLIPKRNAYIKYFYSRSDPGPQKSTAAKESNGEKAESGEKKSMLDKINPFKKKNKDDK